MSIESTVARPATAAIDLHPHKRFVPGMLPWIIAVAALLVYLVTLNHWYSFRSVEAASVVAGWNPQPELTRPLFWLLTYPLRFLPPSLFAIGLNLFSAICGALTLALLARSVALLPHDRTEQQRVRERSPFSLLSIKLAWLPPVVAVLLCGLQLTFWENATAVSNEILDVLVFAFVIRCLLEFRLFGNDSWLLRGAFVYGAGMTGNWAMTAFFPVFLATLIWIKGVGFFNLRFLRQMFFLGSAGLCFYLVLPAVVSWSNPDVGFWQALKANLGHQRNFLSILVNKYWLFQAPSPMWILALFSLMPLLLIGFRSPAYFGDPSKIGVFLANTIFQVLYAAFFILCLWVLLDPPFSPRNYLGAPGLPLYYLAALSIGYFIGYFLLVFGGGKPMLRQRPLPDYPAFLRYGITAIVYVLCAVPVFLSVTRNLPQIRTTNSSWVKNFSQQLAHNVPLSASVVLSDDPTHLMLFQAITGARPGAAAGPISLDTGRLGFPPYQRFLERFYGHRWKSPIPAKQKDPMDNPSLQSLVVGLAASNAVFYLHPSFGFYFEKLYPQPHGINYRLVPYPTNGINMPFLTEDLIAENQSFWQQAHASLFQQLTNAGAAPDPIKGATHKDNSPLGRFQRRLYLPEHRNYEAAGLGFFYSRALDQWGVELQQNGKLAEAKKWFELSHDLNTENVAAEINFQTNAKLEQKEKTPIEHTTSIDEKLGKYATIQNLLNANGPVDEATLCFELGNEFYAGQNFRQAAQEFDRVCFLAPGASREYLEARMAFANACLYNQTPEETLKAVQELKTLAPDRTNAPALLRLEAFGLLFKGDQAGAQRAVEAQLEKFPNDETLLAMATTFYLNMGSVTPGMESNALKTIDRQLHIRPENTSALVNKGLVWLRLGQYTNSIPPLSEVIQMGAGASGDTNVYYAALYNRALAYWKSDQFDAAQKDFEEFRGIYPGRQEISYVLAEIAYTKHETNNALLYYQRYLASTPPTNAPETSNALVKLKELQRGNR